MQTGRLLLGMVSTLVTVFLVMPSLIMIPLSLSSEPFFSLPPPGLSLRWYAEFFRSEAWMPALTNSAVIALATTAIATLFGTMAALGLESTALPGRRLIQGLVLSPLMVPFVVVGIGIYFFYADLGLVNTRPGLILAHATVASPFVVITVSASLSRLDPALGRAAASLGATPLRAFLRVKLPNILPGVAGGAIFAFVASFDETIITLFIAGPEQPTLPKQMFLATQDFLSPTLAAAAVVMTATSIALLGLVELLRRGGTRSRPRNT